VRSLAAAGCRNRTKQPPAEPQRRRPRRKTFGARTGSKGSRSLARSGRRLPASSHRRAGAAAKRAAAAGSPVAGAAVLAAVVVVAAGVAFLAAAVVVVVVVAATLGSSAASAPSAPSAPSPSAGSPRALPRRPRSSRRSRPAPPRPVRCRPPLSASPPCRGFARKRGKSKLVDQAKNPNPHGPNAAGDRKVRNPRAVIRPDPSHDPLHDSLLAGD
jgi:hypothetical protein